MSTESNAKKSKTKTMSDEEAKEFLQGIQDEMIGAVMRVLVNRWARFEEAKKERERDT